MSTYTTIRIPINRPTIELLNRLLEDYKEDIVAYPLISRLRTSIINLYIRDYYISK